MQIIKTSETTAIIIKPMPSQQNEVTRNKLLEKKTHLQVIVDGFLAQIAEVDKQLAYFNVDGTVKLADDKPVNLA